MNLIQHDLEVKQHILAELGRTNLRRAAVEERRRSTELITCSNFGGDSPGLSKNGESSYVDTTTLRLHPYDWLGVPYPASSGYGDALRTAQIGAYRPLFALDLNEVGLTTVTVEASSTNGLLNDTDHRPHESTVPTANTDEGEEKAEGRVGLSTSEVAKHQSILYANQAIPAPVHTNVNELKRITTRKFGNTKTIRIAPWSRQRTQSIHQTPRTIRAL
ncbi:hypothetical protein PHET_12132 [Paragonimus heterotremus]|uniref:Uncharacterized protein n=1 Tax=Paragonimus heterotremus TaxID=100268 RepID=A0A8J4T0G4_9TREM|nr:hypothetical protein PHET_12132 [Paragonimus heterotremus]